MYCGDDSRSKRIAAELIRDVGFDPADAGPLRIARYTEPFALLVAQLDLDRAPVDEGGEEAAVEKMTDRQQHPVAIEGEEFLPTCAISKSVYVRMKPSFIISAFADTSLAAIWAMRTRNAIGAFIAISRTA